MLPKSFPNFLASYLIVLQICPALSWPASQNIRRTDTPWAADHGHNEQYIPSVGHIIPGKKALNFDEKRYYYEHHYNNEKNGTYKRASCPALNVLANRGFIPRSGRKVTYQNLAQSMRNIFNFGDDNVRPFSSTS